MSNTSEPRPYIAGQDPALDAQLLRIALSAIAGGAKGGRVRSEAKQAAARTNGAKGGRPRSPQRTAQPERAPTAGLGLTALAGETPTAPPAGLDAVPKAVELPGGHQ